jgi:response regulator RpfG family c-di-GMP phosphodiesterase
MTTMPTFNTVMLIDDNAIDSFIHTRLFHLYQFSGKNLVHNNCLTALEYLMKNQYSIDNLPELIVLDLHLPVMSGLEFLSAFDGLSELVKSYCQIVILTSCYKGEKMLRSITSEHVWDILEKPLKPENLKGMSNQLIASQLIS